MEFFFCIFILGLSLTLGSCFQCPKCHVTGNAFSCFQQTETCNNFQDVCVGRLKDWKFTMTCGTTKQCDYYTFQSTTECTGEKAFGATDMCTVCCKGAVCIERIGHVQKGLDLVPGAIHCPICDNETDPQRCMDNIQPCPTCEVTKRGRLYSSKCATNTTCTHDSRIHPGRPNCYQDTHLCSVCCSDMQCLDLILGVPPTEPWYTPKIQSPSSEVTPPTMGPEETPPMKTTSIPPKTTSTAVTTTTPKPTSVCKDDSLFPCHKLDMANCNNTDIATNPCRDTCGFCTAKPKPHCPACLGARNTQACLNNQQICHHPDDTCSALQDRTTSSQCTDGHPFTPGDRCVTCCSGDQCLTALSKIQNGLDSIPAVVHCPVCSHATDPQVCLNNFVPCEARHETCEISVRNGVYSSQCASGHTCTRQQQACTPGNTNCQVCCHDHNCVEIMFGLKTTLASTTSQAHVTTPKCEDRQFFPCLNAADSVACQDHEFASNFCPKSCGICSVSGTTPTKIPQTTSSKSTTQEKIQSATSTSSSPGQSSTTQVSSTSNTDTSTMSSNQASPLVNTITTDSSTTTATTLTSPETTTTPIKPTKATSKYTSPVTSTQPSTPTSSIDMSSSTTAKSTTTAKTLTSPDTTTTPTTPTQATSVSTSPVTSTQSTSPTSAIDMSSSTTAKATTTATTFISPETTRTSSTQTQATSKSTSPVTSTQSSSPTSVIDTSLSTMAKATESSTNQQPLSTPSSASTPSESTSAATSTTQTSTPISVANKSSSSVQSTTSKTSTSIQTPSSQYTTSVSSSTVTSTIPSPLTPKNGSPTVQSSTTTTTASSTTLSTSASTLPTISSTLFKSSVSAKQKSTSTTTGLKHTSPTVSRTRYQSTPSTTQPTTQTTIPAGPCQDIDPSIYNCAVLQPCGDPDLAKSLCRKTCKICSTATKTPSALSRSNAEIGSPSANFRHDVVLVRNCTDVDYFPCKTNAPCGDRDLALLFCPVTCKLCNSSQGVILPSASAAASTSSTTPASSSSSLSSSPSSAIPSATYTGNSHVQSLVTTSQAPSSSTLSATSTVSSTTSPTTVTSSDSPRSLRCPLCRDVGHTHDCLARHRNCHHSQDVCMGVLNNWKLSFSCSKKQICQTQQGTRNCTDGGAYGPHDRCYICCEGHTCVDDLRQIQKSFDAIPSALHCPSCHNEANATECLQNSAPCPPSTMIYSRFKLTS